ncbi:MAG TPA: hypothetical protein VNM39_13280 [Verrucomicrobiae bacterium]|nr:hypothetical protein [Verrucomicrobiae bacterium]
MSKAIRLSPSGPNLDNAGGAPFAPGPGAQLRLVEAQCTIGGSLAVSSVPQVVGPTLGAATFNVEFADPNANLNYRATALLDVINTSTNVTASAELYIDTSTDGATWTEQASNSHLVAPGVTRQIRCDLILHSGAALGVVAGLALITRVRVGAAAGTANTVLAESAVTPGGDAKSVGTVLLQLAECF